MGLRRTARAPFALVLAGLLVGALIEAPAATAAQAYPVPATGSITVLGHGLGHGHGMSQYGARGAAAAGLSASQIVAFYYPGTTLATLAAGTQIRVLLSGGYPYPTVAATAGLTLRDASGALMHGVANPLPTTGISRYRLAPAGAGLTLQRLVAAGWANVPGATALPARADFLSPQGYVWLNQADGGSTAYRDKVGAIRNGAGVMTINRVDLEHYTMGVAPREMPSSWAVAAVQAQAIAARTYAVYEMAHAGGGPYDICDTTQCQVYGGMRHYDSGGQLIYTDVPAVVSGTSYRVLHYAGQTIFAQFSASDGGWTVDGGQPYLIARADPYDNVASGDPYLNWSRTVPVASIAANYGLARVSAIEITARDGHGEWGGRVTAGFVTGVDGAGHAKRIATTGFGLQSALGLPHNWFTIQTAVPTVPGAPSAVRAVAADTGAVVSWGAPASTGGVPITSYLLSFGLRTIRVAASVRSAFVGPWNNGVPVSILVRAVNTRGVGPAAPVAVTPAAAPQFVNPLPAGRLFDTRVSHTLVDSAHLFQYDFAGHGGVPATAKAVQVAIEILRPTVSGVLMVRSWGSLTTPVAAIAYRAGVVTTATLTIPLIPSTRVAFMPSAGTVPLSADVMSYSAATGQSVRSVTPEPVQTVPSVPLGAGVAVPLGSVPGVTAATSAVVLSIVGSTAGVPGWLKVWTDGAPAPTVNQVEVVAGGSNANTVVVPIGASRAIRLAASSTQLGATVTLVGVLGPAAAGFGRLESFPPSAIADGTASFIVGGTEFPFTATGLGQLPAAAGVSAVLLHLTVTQRAGSGSLWVYAAGTTRPVTEAVQFGASGAQTATVLVPVSSTGAITFVTTLHTAVVAVDAIGYVTAG